MDKIDDRKVAVLRYINMILSIYLPPSVTSALIILITNLILLFVPRKWFVVTYVIG